MISIMDFKIGDKIEIELSRSTHSSINTPPLISQLEDTNDGLLYISIPLVYGEPYQLNLKTKIKLIIYREDKGIYSFTGEIVNVVKRNILMYGIRPISKVEKEQRRFFYRLQTKTKVILKSMDRKLEETCITKDISGGGLRLSCKNEYNKNERLSCYINVEGEIVKAIGEVLRRERSFVDNQNEIGIRFIEISDAERNKIISYIFKEQRLLRKKGLI